MSEYFIRTFRQKEELSKAFVRPIFTFLKLSLCCCLISYATPHIWLQTVVSRLITHTNRSFSRPPKEQKYCFWISQCLSISLEHLDKKKNYPKLSFVRSLRSSNCTSHKSWTYTLKYKQCCLIISELRSTSQKLFSFQRLNMPLNCFHNLCISTFQHWTVKFNGP